ncbi:hypothetical protein [Aquibacillus salsiterrae]|uniref:Uncharacterized protein n=1 Tax=Aquibacillus salsiterrae TaxID=2950439 RepID=A0A9X4AHM2_9BACI|nr:hypothetical protein [Aquibacillus salsiterrae]MDC3418480.1 hypothetical protein [Aquibacillus salsiterrae]
MKDFVYNIMINDKKQLSIKEALDADTRKKEEFLSHLAKLINNSMEIQKKEA